MDPIDAKAASLSGAGNAAAATAAAQPTTKGRSTDKASNRGGGYSSKAEPTSSSGAKGKNSSDGSASGGSGTANTSAGNGTSSAEKRQCNFITEEVIDATIQCLITQADECEKNMLSTLQTEKMVMEELGRCLVEIIDFSIRTTDSNFVQK